MVCREAGAGAKRKEGANRSAALGRLPSSDESKQDRLCSSQLPQPGRGIRGAASEGAHLLPETSLRPHPERRTGGPPAGLPLPELRGGNRGGDRSPVPGNRAGRRRALRGRVHGRERLRPPRFSRHRRGLHAPGQGCGHAVSGGGRGGFRVGLPGTEHPHAGERRGAPIRQHRRDAVGPALPRGRPVADPHPASGRPGLHRHPRGFAAGGAGRRSGGRSGGTGPVGEPGGGGRDVDPRRLRSAADRVRRGALDRARRRLGIPGIRVPRAAAR